MREGVVLAAHTCEGLAAHRSGRSKMGTMAKETVLDSQGCQPHTGRHGAQLSEEPKRKIPALLYSVTGRARCRGRQGLTPLPLPRLGLAALGVASERA